MPDRPVKGLIFEVCDGPNVRFDRADPLLCEERDFRVRVENGKATFEFKTPYETESEARKAVKDYIDQWEFLAGLQHGSHAFRFRLENPVYAEEESDSGGVRVRATPLLSAHPTSPHCAKRDAQVTHSALWGTNETRLCGPGPIPTLFASFKEELSWQETSVGLGQASLYTSDVALVRAPAYRVSCRIQRPHIRCEPALLVVLANKQAFRCPQRMRQGSAPC